MTSMPITRISPGEVLPEDFLQPLGISQSRLALAIGVPPRRINEIGLGKRRITADTALRLSRHFRTTDGLWMNLRARHDLETGKDRLASELASIQPLAV